MYDNEIPVDVKNITSRVGDATDMTGIKDDSFDLVFTNSCIEHVGKRPEWTKMRNEMMRVGRYYYLQTPNKYFPIEPHFLIPLFQFFPLFMKTLIIKIFPVSWYKDAKTYDEAKAVADSIHLLSHRDLRSLFPNGEIKKEKLCLLTKSFMVTGRCEKTE